MLPFQGKIIIEKNRIVATETFPGSVLIINKGKSNEFINSWAYPGFVDSHGHVAALGSKLTELDLSKCSSDEECVEWSLLNPRFRGVWLTGRGWNEELWRDKIEPDLKLLDYYYPDIPVYFTRVDGHAAWVNSKALQIAGIDEYTKEPDGGMIVKDKSGNPTGVLIDNAMDLVKKFIPRYDKNQLKELILSACNNLSSFGLTQVHEMDLHPDNAGAFIELDNENKLPVKIKAYLSAQKDEWKNYDYTPSTYNNFSICGLKFYTDGALGSRGAALFDKYNDSDSRGMMLINESELFNKSKAGLEKGFHIATHAIGDKANSLVLKTYSKLIEEGIANKDSILRLEHAQTIRTEDLKYLKHKNIIISIQPVHCISDAPMAEKRLGDNCKYAYPWKSVLQSGGRIVAGSDFPIESHNPFIGIDAFVRRVPFNREDSFYPDERISREEALGAYCITPHKIFDEGFNYSDKLVGMEADLTILDKNFLEFDEKDISKTKAVVTVVNGKLIEN
ncbi:MAG: amidohydrolase [Ignavibacteriae bacterium]|nr:amidohydrolase [Ignavibacteriota bacterium]